MNSGLSTDIARLGRERAGGRTARSLVFVVPVFWCHVAACGSPETYSRPGADGGDGSGTGGNLGDAVIGTGGQGSGGSGGTTPVGTGGSGPGSGGIGTGGSGTGGSGTGGAGGSGTGGSATGGRGTGGVATGGSGSGGAATGGRGTGGSGTGGAGTGGSATGGSGTGGSGTGGSGTGGSATGGSGTGGSGTGGSGTGGSGTGGAATGSIISLDFVGGMTGVTPVPMGPGEIAGVKAAANWNSATGTMGSLAALRLGDGSATTASVTWNAPVSGTSSGIWRVSYSDAPGDIRMMTGYLDPTWTSSPATAASLVTFTGLPANIAAGQYDVYVYVLGDVGASENRTYQYGIGTTTFTVVQTGPVSNPPATPYPYTLAPNMGMGNTVVFRQITGASFTLTAKGVSGSPSRFRAPVNGIQIVFPTGS